MILGISGLAGSGKDTFAKFLEPEGAVNVALADPLKRIAREVYAFTDEQLWGASQYRNAPDTRYPRPHTWVLADRLADQEMVCSCCGEGAGRRFHEDDLLLVDEEDVPPCHLTPRYALQLLGTEWGRQCYPDTWAALCVRTAQSLLASPMLRYEQRQGLFRIAETRVWAEADRHERERAKIVTVSDVRFRNEMRVIREAGGKLVRVRRPGAGLKGASGIHPSEAEQMSIPDREFDFVVENSTDLDSLKLHASLLIRQVLPNQE